MKEKPMTDKILEKVVLAALITQIAFIMYMNLFRADTIIDFDSSSAYMHEMEMGSQGKLFPAEYSYQASMDLDGAAVISAFFYHFTKNIFIARGIANNLVVLLYIFVVNSVVRNLSLSKTWKRFGILLFFIPYSVNILGYWRTLFVGGGFFAFRALVPLLMISLLTDIDRGKKLREYTFRAILLIMIVFLTGLSSGGYILLCAVFPLIWWEALRVFMKADYTQIMSKRTLLGSAAVLAALAGLVLQKIVGFSSTADSKIILTSDKWTDAILSSFAGIFELFGGLTVHENVRLFSPEAAGTAVDFAVTCILMAAVIATFANCVKKKEISHMNGYIFSVMLVNMLMFSFLDLKYGDTVFESRYHLIPMLPSFFLLIMILEKLDKGKIKKVQVQSIHILVVGLFILSMLYGDAQWVYAKTALGSEKLAELNNIIENEDINTAFVVGEDSKDLGRKLRVYSRDTHYIVVNDGAESAFRTTWGGTTRYLDNSMQQGKTAIIATPESYKTLPAYLVLGMKYLRDYDGLKIYAADESRFDCVGGIVAAKDRVVDFPYSPGYISKNAKLTENGSLIIKEDGGRLRSEYPSVKGKWNYKVYYDMPMKGSSGLMQIKLGDRAPLCVKLDPTVGTAGIEDVEMTGKEKVAFSVSGSKGVRIKSIEISRSE
ncbi:MAG: hypothetical protein K6G84_02045 [Lachnospiraceae bacterium]|nr:hypothetical protein [Lachnospiraceae bacterium]